MHKLGIHRIRAKNANADALDLAEKGLAYVKREYRSKGPGGMRHMLTLAKGMTFVTMAPSVTPRKESVERVDVAEESDSGESLCNVAGGVPVAQLTGVRESGGGVIKEAEVRGVHQLLGAWNTADPDLLKMKAALGDVQQTRRAAAEIVNGAGSGMAKRPEQEKDQFIFCLQMEANCLLLSEHIARTKEMIGCLQAEDKDTAAVMNALAGTTADTGFLTTWLDGFKDLPRLQRVRASIEAEHGAAVWKGMEAKFVVVPDISAEGTKALSQALKEHGVQKKQGGQVLGAQAGRGGGLGRGAGRGQQPQWKPRGGGRGFGGRGQQAVSLCHACHQPGHFAKDGVCAPGLAQLQTGQASRGRGLRGGFGRGGQ